MTLTAMGALAGLALIDSTSFGTLGVPVGMLAQRRVRAWTVLLYLLALALFYWVLGLALLRGIGAVAALLDGGGAPGAAVSGPVATIAQVALGAGLLALSFVVWPAGTERQEARRRRRAERGPGPVGRAMARVSGGEAGAPAVVGLAVVAGTVEAASMVPYLGAIGLIAAAPLGAAAEAAVLAGYVAVMMLPALALLTGRLAAARALEPLLVRISAWLARSGDATLGWVLGIVGVLLLVNGLGRLDVLSLVGAG